MPQRIEAPSIIPGVGSPSKRIEEFVGRARTGHSQVSVARMRSPRGWKEPGQRPEFDEITVVLSGSLRVEHEDGELDISGGQAVVARAGEWVRYSTPLEDTDYLAVCLPAFSPKTVHRDEEP